MDSGGRVKLSYSPVFLFVACLGEQIITMGIRAKIGVKYLRWMAVAKEQCSELICL